MNEWCGSNFTYSSTRDACDVFLTWFENLICFIWEKLLSDHLHTETQNIWQKYSTVECTYQSINTGTNKMIK